jgi:hypothetical protein
VNISKTLDTLSRDDRDALECFFYHLSHSGCSYVLFGNKPMSISSFLEIEPNFSQSDPVNNLRDLSSRLCLQNLKIYRGWEVWKKCKHLFPSSNFVLLENRDAEGVTIVIINKHNFLKKVKENIDIFKEVLGAHVTPNIILDSCFKSNNIFKEALKNNEALLGILLGFGRYNAQLFARRTEIERESNPRKILLTKKTPSSAFSTIEEEYRYINETLTGFNQIGTPDLNPILMPMPGFAADHSHPETQQLKAEYRKQYKRIINKCKNGDFLETILKQFCD